MNNVKSVDHKLAENVLEAFLSIFSLRKTCPRCGMSFCYRDPPGPIYCKRCVKK